MKKTLLFFSIFIVLVLLALSSYLLFFWNNNYMFKLQGSAMEPTYKSGDTCTADKKAYISTVPVRGDIILFNGTTDHGKPTQWVKRIVGLPNDRFMIQNGSVFLNGSKFQEPYLSSEDITKGSPNNILKENQEVFIPENKFVVLGDNRNFSMDSREYGFIDELDIVGKIVSCNP